MIKNLNIDNDTLSQLITVKIQEMKLNMRKISKNYDVVDVKEAFIPSKEICLRCKNSRMIEAFVILGEKYRDFNNMNTEEIFRFVSGNAQIRYKKETMIEMPIVFYCKNCIYFMPIQGWDKFEKQWDKLSQED